MFCCVFDVFKTNTFLNVCPLDSVLQSFMNFRLEARGKLAFPFDYAEDVLSRFDQ